MAVAGRVPVPDRGPLCTAASLSESWFQGPCTRRKAASFSRRSCASWALSLKMRGSEGCVCGERPLLNHPHAAWVQLKLQDLKALPQSGLYA